MQASTAPGIRPEDASVVDSVLTAMMTIGRTMRQRFEGDHLEPGTYWLLKTLSTGGPMRVTELAGCTNLDTSTVSRHVAQLDRAGVVERTPDPDDRRAQRIQLTAAGQAQLHDAFERRRQLLHGVLDGWDAADVAQLDRLLGRFVADVDTSHAELEHA